MQTTIASHFSRRSFLRLSAAAVLRFASKLLLTQS
jgi:hypothetical protein